MTATYVQKGDSIDYTPEADVSAGDVVVLGTNLIGIAKLDIKANELGALSLVGVFDMPKETGNNKDIAQGVNAYWDTVSQVVTTDDANQFLGKSIQAAGEDDTSVRIRLQQ
jgi:predicted RecA/RadA family phage recombinase